MEVEEYIVADDKSQIGSSQPISSKEINISCHKKPCTNGNADCHLKRRKIWTSAVEPTNGKPVATFVSQSQLQECAAANSEPILMEDQQKELTNTTSSTGDVSKTFLVLQSGKPASSSTSPKTKAIENLASSTKQLDSVNHISENDLNLLNKDHNKPKSVEQAVKQVSQRLTENIELIDISNGDDDSDSDVDIIEVIKPAPVLVDLTVDEEDNTSLSLSGTSQLQTMKVKEPSEVFALPCMHDASYLKNGICEKPCMAELLCGDKCGGTCHSCNQGRIHQLCTEFCGNLLICGHVCKIPCKEICPPCPMPCVRGCSHGKCPLICGAPCVPCMQPCSSKCVHSVCSKLCSEECDRDLCSWQCQQMLPCLHCCVGVCGEECPPCKTCQPHRFTHLFMSQEEEDPNAR